MLSCVIPALVLLLSIAGSADAQAAPKVFTACNGPNSLQDSAGDPLDSTSAGSTDNLCKTPFANISSLAPDTPWYVEYNNFPTDSVLNFQNAPSADIAGVAPTTDAAQACIDSYRNMTASAANFNSSKVTVLECLAQGVGFITFTVKVNNGSQALISPPKGQPLSINTTSFVIFMYRTPNSSVPAQQGGGPALGFTSNSFTSPPPSTTPSPSPPAGAATTHLSWTALGVLLLSAALSTAGMI